MHDLVHVPHSKRWTWHVLMTNFIVDKLKKVGNAIDKWMEGPLTIRKRPRGSTGCVETNQTMENNDDALCGGHVGSRGQFWREESHV